MHGFTRIGRAACLVASCAVVAGCQQGKPLANQANVENSVGSPVHNVAAQILTPQPPMDRAALLEAVASARSAAAAGSDDRQAQQPLDGQAFEFRIRFGCAGPDSTKGLPLGWSLDSKGAVLRVHAASDIAKDDPVVAAMNLQAVEEVEGVWIDRPWLLQAACPAGAAPVPTIPADEGRKPAGMPMAPATEPQPLAAVPETGIAQFFTASDPRTARRGNRPYEAVKKLDDGAVVGNEGFDLVLSGRLRALAGGRVIRCVVEGPDAPPACIVSASFDHVWIEDAASKDRIADWSSS